MEKGNVGAIHESPVLNVDKKGDVFQGASPLENPRAGGVFVLVKGNEVTWCRLSTYTVGQHIYGYTSNSPFASYFIFPSRIIIPSAKPHMTPPIPHVTKDAAICMNPMVLYPI